MATTITDEMRREWMEFIRLHPPYTDEEINTIPEWEQDGDRLAANMLQKTLNAADNNT